MIAARRRMTNTPLSSARATAAARARLDDSLSPESERAAKRAAAAVVDGETAIGLTSVFLDFAFACQRAGASPARVVVLRIERDGVPSGFSGDVRQHGRRRRELELRRERSLRTRRRLRLARVRRLL